MSERKTRTRIPEGTHRVINAATGEVKLTMEGLKQQVKELTAKNAHLCKAIDKFLDENMYLSGEDEAYDNLQSSFNETPAQSLAHIQVEAIEEMRDKKDIGFSTEVREFECEWVISVSEIDAHIEQLRNKP